jgi:hypothetical protein
MRPPFEMMKIAVPFSYLPAVLASFLPPLAVAVEPVVVAVPDAAAVITTALTFAPRSKLPEVN